MHYGLVVCSSNDIDNIQHKKKRQEEEGEKKCFPYVIIVDSLHLSLVGFISYFISLFLRVSLKLIGFVGSFVFFYVLFSFNSWIFYDIVYCLLRTQNNVAPFDNLSTIRFGFSLSLCHRDTQGRVKTSQKKR